MYRRIIFSAIIIMGLMLASCGGSASTSPPEPNTSAIDAGAIYRTTCVACHGVNREGVTGLGKPLTPESLASRSDAEIRDIITNGKPNTAMQSFKGSLSADEVNALVQFIKNIEP